MGISSKLKVTGLVFSAGLLAGGITVSLWPQASKLAVSVQAQEPEPAINLPAEWTSSNLILSSPQSVDLLETVEQTGELAGRITYRVAVLKGRYYDLDSGLALAAAGDDTATTATLNVWRQAHEELVAMRAELAALQAACNALETGLPAVISAADAVIASTPAEVAGQPSGDND